MTCVAGPKKHFSATPEHLRTPTKPPKMGIGATFLACIFMSAQTVSAQTPAGQEVGLALESGNHPYVGIPADRRAQFAPAEGRPSAELITTKTLFSEGATYVAPHFSRVELAKGDFIVVRSPDGLRTWRHSREDVETRRSRSFWSIPVPGDSAIIELHIRSTNGAYGWTIDKYARGVDSKHLSLTSLYTAICGEPDTEEAKCVQNDPPIYNTSRAVARLLVNGTVPCTGWLLGSEGHLVTNNHCIPSAAAAANTTVELMAEGESCGTDCKEWQACPGTVVAASTTLVLTSHATDVTLVKLPENVSSKYGYLRLRKAGPVQGERIYIPQYPRGWGKRVAVKSTDPADGGFAHVNKLDAVPCRDDGKAPEMGYQADTDEGASGSPVIAHQDNLVIGLHHCGGCPNRGIDVKRLIGEFGGKLPRDAVQ